MAIIPTGAIYKSLIFDGEDSRNYGVYITGEAVYNAPSRDVEMISIPGRSGAFALDNGRFENIEVSYPAGIFAKSEEEFAEAISNFRNLLCSRNGYVRLSDEYNPDEYRMAIYKSGLEVYPTQLKAGEFNIVFDCKPQRWLISGEEKEPILDGQTIINPTLFEASPLLEVEGYGTIMFNGYDIELSNEVLGDVTLAASGSFLPSIGTTQYERRIRFNDSLLNTGDSFSIGFKNIDWSLFLDGWVYDYPFAGQSVTDSNNDAVTTWNAGQIIPDRPYPQSEGSWTSNYNYTTKVGSISFAKGTSKNWTNTATVASTPIALRGSSTRDNISASFIVSVSYDGNAPEIVISLSITLSDSNIPLVHNTRLIGRSQYTEISGYSTISQLGNPTYIDCDLGEAYMIKDGVPVSLNSYIDLGSNLPKLASGSNVVNFNNTITDFKIIPRWWKI